MHKRTSWPLVPGGLDGKAALYPQDIVSYSAERVHQTWVLPVSFCILAAVVELEEASVSVLLVTLLVIRQLGSFAANCTHIVPGLQLMGSIWMSSRNQVISSSIAGNISRESPLWRIWMTFHLELDMALVGTGWGVCLESASTVGILTMKMLILSWRERQFQTNIAKIFAITLSLWSCCA